MFTDIFVPEVVGTFVLIMMGCGVVANAILPKTKGHVLGSSWLLINWGWGLAVTFAVYVAWKSGAHLNPAVTLGLLAAGSELGVSLSSAEVMTYIAGQLLGAMPGALVVWVVYKSDVAGFGAVGANGVPMPNVPAMGSVWADWGATEAALIGQKAGDPKAAWAKMVTAIEGKIK